MAKPARRPGNLPAETTSFIGRRRELAELRKKLAATRLVSLLGPGGVGKTRLALRAASELGRNFSGGAWLVELADVRDPALVGNAVMAALDLRDQAAKKRLVKTGQHATIGAQREPAASRTTNQLQIGPGAARSIDQPAVNFQQRSQPRTAGRAG